MNVIQEGERSERRDEELETRIVGLEAMLSDAQAEIEHLRKLLLTGLALHGGAAHTYSEKEWRVEARAALGIRK